MERNFFINPTLIKTCYKSLKIRFFRVKFSTDIKIEEYLLNKWGKWFFFVPLRDKKEPHLALLEKYIEDGYS